MDQFTEESGSSSPDGSVATRGRRFPLHQQFRLNLHGLAHVEFHGTNGHPSWRVAPPALAINGLSTTWRGVVCGARWPGFGTQIESSLPAAVRLTVSPQLVAPDSYFLETTDPGVLLAAGAKSGLTAQPNAPLALLMCLPPIAHKFLRRDRALPHGTDWHIGRFSTQRLQWVPSDRRAAELDRLGLYRFALRHERRYFLCARGKAYPIPNQVGKYLVVRRQRRTVVRYNPAAQTFSVPAICQPPALIERALILCSGCLPCLDGASHSLAYGYVGREVAQAAARLLGQPIR